MWSGLTCQGLLGLVETALLGFNLWAFLFGQNAEDCLPDMSEPVSSELVEDESSDLAD